MHLNRFKRDYTKLVIKQIIKGEEEKNNNRHWVFQLVKRSKLSLQLVLHAHVKIVSF